MSHSETEISSPEDQFVYDLRGVYDMELQLVDALADMSQKATNDNLVKGFALHRTETENQAHRVETAFAALGAEPTRRENPLVDGLLAETAQFESRTADDHRRNRHYFHAAVATERIEIASYEALLATATEAGLGADVTDPLEANLAEEEKTLRKLEGLGENGPLETLWTAVTGT